jgi:predicted molibdopterin-dependent oxidoreductase YjgC
VLYKDSFATSDRRAHLFPLEECGPEELPSDDYPLVLTTGRLLPFYHSDSMTGKSISLKKFRGDAHVFVNQEDAKRIGIVDEQLVVVNSRRGSIKTKAKISDEVQPGLVFISLHHSVNILTGRALDPVAKTPEAKYCAVRIEHAEGSKGKEA